MFSTKLFLEITKGNKTLSVLMTFGYHLAGPLGVIIGCTYVNKTPRRMLVIHGNIFASILLILSLIFYN